MTYLIAAAGTGGHVFPGLSVAEALLDLGVQRSGVHFVGGSRLEAKVYPDEGFSFLEVEIRGLQRSMTKSNLSLPKVMTTARNQIQAEIKQRGVKAVLGMGGYVTIPAGWAAKRSGIPFLNSEQNAEAGLANKVASRWAQRTFVAFPNTRGLPRGEWVGNPVRAPFWKFRRTELADQAKVRYDLPAGVPVLGVFGGSLGAGILNEQVAKIAQVGIGSKVSIVHITGPDHLHVMEEVTAADSVHWVRVGFEEQMELFYAASDLVLARAGGAVAELTATATPSVLVPGTFGSAGHQRENASFLKRSGAARVVTEDEVGSLSEVIRAVLTNQDELSEMRKSAAEISRPHAAHTIATALMEAA